MAQKSIKEIYKNATDAEQLILAKVLQIEANQKNMLEGIAALQEIAAENYKYISNSYYRAAIKSGVGISVAENEVAKNSKKMQQKLDERSLNMKKNNNDFKELFRKITE